MITSAELLLNTALISILSAVLSVVFGFPVGVWLASLNPQLQKIVGAILVVPFLLPALLVGVALKPFIKSLEVDSNIGILLILVAHTLMNFGFIARVVAASSIAKDQVEAARLDGASDSIILRSIQLPQQRTAILSAALLIALYSATSYGLVVLLGQGKVQTLETEIARSALQNLDLQTALTLAGLQSLITLVLFAIAKNLGAAPSVLDQNEGSAISSTWLWRLIGTALTLTVIFILGSVLFESLSQPGFANYLNLQSRGTRSLLNISAFEAALNSIRNAFVVLLIVLPAGLALAKRYKSSSWVLIPLGISPVVVGLAALIGSGYLPREISGSWVLVPIVQSLFALPLAYQILRPALCALDPDIKAAAALDGARGSKAFWLVEYPQIKRPLALATAFAGLSSLGEFGAASFLAFGSQETLPIVIFRLASRPGGDNFGMAMAAASIYILLTACILLFSSRLQKN